MPHGRSRHTATYQGHWVKITLQNGIVIIDRFKDRTGGKRIILENYPRRIKSLEIRLFEVIKKADYPHGIVYTVTSE